MPVMPDTRIAGGALSTLSGGQASGESGVFGTLGQMMKIKEGQSLLKQRELETQKAQIAMDEAQRKQAAQARARQALQTHERPEDAIDWLMKNGDREEAGELATTTYTARKQQLEAAGAATKAQADTLDYVGQMAQGWDSQATLDVGRPVAIKMLRPLYGDAAESMVPKVYDEAGKAQIAAGIKSATSRATTLNDAHNAITRGIARYTAGLERAPGQIDKETGEVIRPGNWSYNGLQMINLYREGLAQDLKMANSEEAWNAVLQTHYDTGTPEEVLKAAKGWHPDPKVREERLRDLGMTIKEQTNADTAAARTESYIERNTNLNNRNPGGQTPTQANALQDRQHDGYAEIEKWFRQVHEDDVLANEKNWPTETDPKSPKSGQRVKPGLSVQNLTPEHQREYVEKKLYLENTTRTRRNPPELPLQDAARVASQAGDMGEYTRLENIFNGLTQGLVKLNTIVAPPGKKLSTPVTPDQQAKQKAWDELEKQITAETDTTKRNALKARQAALLNP